MAKQTLAKRKMAKAVDFEKLRKKRQRTQSVKRLIALCVILGGALGVIALNQFLIEAGVTTRISDMVGSVGGSGFPVPVPGGVIRDVKGMGGDLAILNDTNLYVYNAKGKQVTNLQQKSDNTVMVPTSSQVLTYDVGSRSFSIDTKSKNLLTKETEFGILCADMNEQGVVAVGTSSRQYVAQVLVYNKKLDPTPIYEWLISDNMLAALSLSPKGDKMAAVCLNTSGGQLQTILYTFSFHSSQVQAQLAFEGELVQGLAYLDDGTVGLLTDQNYRVITEGGTVKFTYPLGEGQLAAAQRQDKSMLLMTRQPENRTYHLTLVDGGGRELAALDTADRVRDIALGSREIYLLTDTGIHTYDHSFAPKSSLEQRGIHTIQLVKNTLYYLTAEEILVL